MLSATDSTANNTVANASASSSASTAQQLATQYSGPGGYDMAGLASNLSQQQQSDPAGAAQTMAQLEGLMTPVERGQFAAAVDAVNDNSAMGQRTATNALAPTPAGPDPVQLGLDLGQMALDITGIVDPTPISDGSNAVISVGRSIGSLFSGDIGEAGGPLLNAGISAVAIVPALGDVAKAGKIGNWAQTVADSVSAIAHNPAARAALEPGLRTIKDAVDKIPQSAMDALPASARESIESMKRQLDDHFAPPSSSTATPRIADAAQAGVHTVKVGANSVEWTVDANGYPRHVEATLSDLQPAGTPRSSAETNAQDQVRERGIDGDDAGHVIGHRFLGDQGTRNMFPQQFNFNRGAYKTMENEWAAWIDHGGTVKAKVDLLGGTPERPEQVKVTYEVLNDVGKRVFRNTELFDNAAGQTFERVPTDRIANLLR
ncbi:DNA/RNA non-specific endonuclease [Novosphingobium sp. RD2P27]|uniref:DNA/RNA non-specific endonuclease n=1 Tax=Novosphingobium kalidii TaxID=3230299 RepID=A0ABV2D1U8_9SPHN